MSLDPQTLVAAWRAVLAHGPHAWALFAHGTCVVMPGETAADLAARAIQRLRDEGPALTGGSNFGVVPVPAQDGWIVTSPNLDIMTFVGAAEYAHIRPSDVAVGLRGRKKRGDDVREATLCHVETARPQLARS